MSPLNPAVVVVGAGLSGLACALRLSEEGLVVRLLWEVTLPGGLLVCGDHRDTASLHGALLSGRRAAEAVKASLGHAGVPDCIESVEADPVDAGAGGMPRSVAEVA